MTIVEDYVDGSRFCDTSKDVRPINRCTDKPNLALVLQAMQSRNGLMDDLVDGAEFHVMDLKDINIVSAQSAKRCFEPLDNGALRKIEVVEAVSAAFGPQYHLVP